MLSRLTCLMLAYRNCPPERYNEQHELCCRRPPTRYAPFTPTDRSPAPADSPIGAGLRHCLAGDRTLGWRVVAGNGGLSDPLRGSRRADFGDAGVLWHRCLDQLSLSLARPG